MLDPRGGFMNRVKGVILGLLCGALVAGLAGLPGCSREQADKAADSVSEAAHGAADAVDEAAHKTADVAADTSETAKKKMDDAEEAARAAKKKAQKSLE
jgi:hypothetical protein